MLYRILHKGCPRCGGDLFMEHEDDGLYLTCIQCGTVENELTRRLQMHIDSHVAIEDNWWNHQKAGRFKEHSQ